MANNRSFYLVMMVLGTVGPWYFFSAYLGENGIDLTNFLGALFGNQAANGAMTDLLISAVVFCIWSYTDARRQGIKNWWLVIPAALTVGLSLAMPLYLWLRADTRDDVGVK